MKWLLPLVLALPFLSSSFPDRHTLSPVLPAPVPVSYVAGSWPDFLQHLPYSYKPIVDYAGRTVSNQGKHFAMLSFDVGKEDLQQCADALMRLRAEYLFSAKRGKDIGFHFQAGPFYPWTAYRSGIRPVLNNGRLRLVRTMPACDSSYHSLRKYLDIVFAYSGTVSLCKELPATQRLTTGTVIIWPGNPGHCTIVIDAAVIAPKDTVYRLAEGYMPAQGIYILSNPYEPALNPWYHLQAGNDISTASCDFRSYYLRRFE